MCSVSGSNEDEELQKKHPLSSALCMKCGEQPHVVVRGRDPMCTNCFSNYTTHKFRAALGKSKLIKDNEKVLLAVSGGPRSCCMLHLVKEGFSPSAAKRLKFSPIVVHVDESSIYDCANSKQDVERLAIESKIPFYCVGLDEVFKPLPSAQCSGVGCSDAKTELSSVDQLRGFLECADGFTAKEGLLRSLRMQTILEACKRHNCTKVFVGESSTSLSIKILSNIAEGRGATLPYDVGFADYRYDTAAVLRPIRDFSSNEVAMYNRLHGVDSCCHRDVTTGMSAKASIHRQTEAFVAGLQASFPSTVNTILRTGEKLCIERSLQQSDAKCAMCYAPINQEESDVTRDADASPVDKAGCCTDKDVACCQDNTTSRLEMDEVLPSLCYGCQICLEGQGFTSSILPKFVVDRTIQHRQRQHMRDSIKDFILDDSDV